MNDSPAVILYDGYGNPAAIREGDIITPIQPAYLVAGRDENDQARIIRVGDDGSIIVDIQNPITIDGYVSVQSIQDPVTVQGSVSIDNTVTVDGYVEINGVVQTAPAPLRAVESRYFTGSNIITGTGAAQVLCTLENPAGSGVTVYLTYFDVNGMASVNNFTTPFLYRASRLTALPTGGTVLTEEQRSTSEPVSVGIVRQSSTATATAGYFWVGSPGLVRGGNQNRPTRDVAFSTDIEDKEVIIQEGEAIGIFADPNSIDWSHYVNIRWNEVII